MKKVLISMVGILGFFGSMGIASAAGAAVEAANRVARALHGEHTENHTATLKVSYMHDDGPAIVRVKLAGNTRRAHEILNRAKQSTVDDLRSKGFHIEEQVTESSDQEKYRGGHGGYLAHWIRYEAHVSK
jgi:Asp-tRNA(Asn)/Glu-tRNA(Gln) amidotransferase A subunit family amidase